MTAEIIPFPGWKDHASAAERFEELAHYARAKPERFAKVIVVYHEEKPNGFVTTRQVSTPMSSMEALGLLELGKQAILDNRQ